MAVTLTATLLTASNPQPVQVVLNGTTTGQAYEIRGTTSDGSSWAVPGGKGTSTGAQVSVIDNRSALNVPITYQVVVDGVTYTAATVTVTYNGVGVLQTLDGQTIVGIQIASLTEPRKRKNRSSVFEIAGRNYPAARLDVPGSPEYSWQFDTQSTDTAKMVSIITAGVPVVRRLQPGIRDLQAVVIGILSGDATDELITVGVDTWRRWTLTVREISDPQPSAVIAAYVWDDFDTAMNKPRVWSYYTTFPSLTGWVAGNCTLSNPATGGYVDNGPFARCTVTTAATAASISEAAFNTTAAPGDVWTVTARVKGVAGRTAFVYIGWGGAGTSITGTPVAISTQWQQISLTATAPALTTGFAVGVFQSATGTLSGDLFDVDSITVSKGSGVPVGTFDDLFSTWDQFDTADWAQYF